MNTVSEITTHSDPDSPGDQLDSLLGRVARLSALSGCEIRTVAVTEPLPIDLPVRLREALAKPAGGPRLAQLARDKSSVAIITSDATRAVPNRTLLPPILEELAGAGIPPGNVTIVFGGGAHRPVTEDDVERLLGGDPDRVVRVAAHDARVSDCVSVGRTPGGNDVRINRVVAEADLKIALGVVEAHEFAGFTGGRKAVLPAVAAYETILHNHRLEMIADPRARTGVLDGNPVHEEMLAAMRLAGLDFIVNVVLDRALRPVAVATGEPEIAHAQLVEFVREFATVSRPPAADLIVTGPDAPLDINLYQSIKTLVALEPIVDRDTTVVLCSSCHEGVGSREMLRPFAGAATIPAALAAAALDYTVEQDHSYLVARFLSRCERVVAWCPGVSDHDLRQLHFDPAATVEEAVVRARRQLRCRRAHPLVLLFPRPQRALFATTDDETSSRPTATPTQGMVT